MSLFSTHDLSCSDDCDYKQYERCTAAKECCIKDSLLARGASCVSACHERYCSHVRQQPIFFTHTGPGCSIWDLIPASQQAQSCKAHPEPDERQHGITTTHSSAVGLLNHVLHFVLKESCDGFRILSGDLHMVLQSYLRNRKCGEQNNAHKPMTRNSLDTHDTEQACVHLQTTTEGHSQVPLMLPRQAHIW